MYNFRKGDRVKYSKEALMTFNLKYPDRVGTVQTDSYNTRVSVLWDNRKTINYLNEIFLEDEE